MNFEEILFIYNTFLLKCGQLEADSSHSVQFSHSVVSDSLWPHEPQHTRPPCPSPTPRVHPNPCPSSRWCHLTISSSVIPFFSCPQSSPASGSFPMNQLFASGGQSTGVSASTSVLPVNTQDWSPLGWTGWISLQWTIAILKSSQDHVPTSLIGVHLCYLNSPWFLILSSGLLLLLFISPLFYIKWHSL